jgi:hypothetical protein
MNPISLRVAGAKKQGFFDQRSHSYRLEIIRRKLIYNQIFNLMPLRMCSCGRTMILKSDCVKVTSRQPSEQSEIRYEGRGQKKQDFSRACREKQRFLSWVTGRPDGCLGSPYWGI